MIVLIAIIAFVALTTVLVMRQARFGRLPMGERLERIKKSPNYRDGEFKNLSETPTFTSDESKFKVFADFFFGEKPRVEPIDSIPSVKTDLNKLPIDQDQLVWFGHSSYLLQLEGKRILVDPVLSGHASPFFFMVNAFKGADIYKAEDMPAIDYLIITHDHWDHLDYHALKSLKDRVKKVICPLGVGAHLEYWGYAPEIITELDWYEQTELPASWKITATPARHFSGRGFKRNQTLWASFVLKTPAHNLFIGGDGGYDTHLAKIGEQYGPFDLAFIEQGQYNQRWKYIHLLPEQLFLAAANLNAKRILPVHNSKFALASHPWDEPLSKMDENKATSTIPVLTPKIGEVVNLNDSTQVFSPWWTGVN